jgi:hypothetical protein
MDDNDIIKSMKVNRFDLSDYLIHFTRSTGKHAFENLKSIIASGKINPDWAIRKGKRGVYGNYPAVCFTDMPLFSFYQYVKNRHADSKVDFYGIAISKDQMFRLGARNVIYGTTNLTEDKGEPDSGERRITPYLPETEQYRYILTNIDEKNDWTHEREWRWTNQFGKSHDNNLPIWRNNSFNETFGDLDFDQQKPIFILTAFESEVKEIMKLFERFKDPRIYNSHNIKRTYVVSRESIEKSGCLSYDKMKFKSLYHAGLLRAVVSEQ